MIKKIVETLLKVVIIFFLFAGMLDFAFFAKSKLSKIYIGQTKWLTPPSFTNEISLIPLAGVGWAPQPYSEPKIHITAEGRRGLPPQNPEEINHRYLLIGSSQSLGYYANDDIIFSTLLQQRHSTWEILNYGSPGDRINAMRKRLDYVLQKESNIERVIAFGGGIDLFFLCITPMPDFYPPEDAMSFQRLYYKLKNRLRPQTFPATNCGNPKVAALAARGVYEDMLSFLDTADRLSIQAQIVLPPVYFAHPPSMQRAADNPGILEQSHLYSVPYLALQSLIAQGGEPRILDLSRVVDHIDAPFFDKRSHLNAAGHQAMAEALEKLLQAPISSPAQN
jgi:lysophospholipase L1-like esterase